MDNFEEHISRLREDFTKGRLNKRDINENPFSQFTMWVEQAVEAHVPEPQAMTLSTVSTDGKPSSRVVYLRGFENGCFWFYGNYESRKGQQLANNPNACLNFFWPLLERQIRVEGSVSTDNTERSDEYYNNRPLESKIGAWASPQSLPLDSRHELEDRVEHFKKKFEGLPIKRPPYWGGWKFKANYYEFWQGRKSRLHDRISYTQKPDGWIIKRLAP